MKKLEVLKYEFANGVMTIVWHRFNTEDNNQNATGQWQLYRELSKAEVLQYAKDHCDKDIEVSIV